MSWRRLEDMSWRCLENMPWRLLEDVLETWLEDVLQTCLEDILKTCLEDVLKTLWKQAKYLLEISVSNKSRSASNKSIFSKSTFDNSKTNPKCIKWNPSFQYLSYFRTQAPSLFQELKSLMTVWCFEISWIQIRHSRKGEAIKTNF